MILQLHTLPDTLTGPIGDGYAGKLPKRARFLAPDAALGLADLEMRTGGLVYTDIFRSAEGSLAARASKRGVQPPAYSAHNYGFAVDIDLDTSLRAHHLKYPALVQLLQASGWFCHRRDGDATRSEAWHFNYFGDKAPFYLAKSDPKEPRTWARSVEGLIFDRYGAAFGMTWLEAQVALQKLGFYHGSADGIPGPLTKEALAAFQRAWYLPGSNGLDGRSQRTLAYCAATVQLELPPNV